jgi:predicted phage tail component-like protein
MGDIVVATLGGVSSADIDGLVITGVTRQITPTIRDTYLDVPGRPGSWYFAEAPGDRELTLEVAITAATFAERRAAARKLGRWLYSNEQRQLVLDDEPGRYELAQLAGAPELAELVNLGRGSVPFRVGPFAISETLDEATGTLTAGGDSTVITVTPADDLADTIPPVITIEPTGPLTGFTLGLGGNELVYDGPIAGSDVILITTETLSVTLNGDPALTNVAGVFGSLVSGANTLTWESDGAAVISAEWRARFI